MKFSNLVVDFLFVITIYSCNSILCGDLNSEWLTLKLNAEKKFSTQFDIESIPCEFYYINIRIKENSFDSASLKALHHELYDSTKKIGWPTFVVYDRDGDYLFHDVRNGVKYIK